MSWEVGGTYMEACNCETACRCVSFSQPAEGDCTVVIDQGTGKSGVFAPFAYSG